MRKLLLIAYKIEQGKGSEDGTGYHIAAELAAHHPDMTLISRVNNIEKLRHDPNFRHMTLIGVDVPSWLGFFKKGGKGITLYYYLWQICVGLKIRTLERFDVIHQLNFHALWAPHFIFSKAKIIWGPLTEHPRVPFDCWYQSKFLYAGEIIKTLAKCLFRYCDPFLLPAVLRSDTVFLGQTKTPYPFNRGKTVFLPQAASVFETGQTKEIDDVFSILFVGRFVDLKGVMLAIQAVEQANLPDKTQITFIGDGPLLPQMQTDRVKILPWQNQQDLQQHYKKADLFLFPSFESQGLVVAEALAHGCPVLCLQGTGPSMLAGNAGICVKQGKNQDIVNTLALEIRHISSEYWHQPEKYRHRTMLAFKRARDLSWPHKAKGMMVYYG